MTTNSDIICFDNVSEFSEQREDGQFDGLKSFDVFILVFHKCTKLSLISNFVLLYICSSFFYLHHMMLVNMKLDVSRHKRIALQGYRILWSSSFQKAQLKLIWLLCWLPRGQQVLHQR